MDCKTPLNCHHPLLQCVGLSLGLFQYMPGMMASLENLISGQMQALDKKKLIREGQLHVDILTRSHRRLQCPNHV